MRIVVDLNRCQGYAQCVPLASDVLKLLGEEALALPPKPRRFAAPTSIARGGVMPGAGRSWSSHDDRQRAALSDRRRR